jgi:hypothetical protein
VLRRCSNNATTRETNVEANAFLDYLHEHTGTSDLAESLAAVLDLRRATAARRRARGERGIDAGVRIAS